MNLPKITRCTLVSLLLSVALLPAAPLEGWRTPWYRVAGLFDSLQSSPSGMFWDEIRGRGLFGTTFWEDSLKRSGNYWHPEPSLSLSLADTPFVHGEKYSWHFDFVNDIRFERFFIRQTLDVDARYSADPDYVWHQDRGAAGRIEEAYVQADYRHGFVRLGRLKRNWGPFAERSLLLSSNPHTYDALEWALWGNFFEFRQLFAAFDYASSSRDTDVDVTDTIAGKRVPRYLTAHALNIMPFEWLSVGIVETALFSRPTGLPDFQYVNPFSIYTVTNTNMEGAANLMLGFHYRAGPFFNKLSTAGQVILDDIQVDDEDIGDQEPNHWGGDFEVSLKNALPLPFATAVTLQYRYLSRFLYLVTNDNTRTGGERYTYLGRGLGAAVNDGDRWQLCLDMVGKQGWLATLGGAYGRNGSNTVTSPWNTDRGWNGYRTETILRSDSAQHTFECFGSVRGWLAPWVSAEVGGTALWSRIPRESSDFERTARIYFSLSGHYPNLYLLLNRLRVDTHGSTASKSAKRHTP